MRRRVAVVVGGGLAVVALGAACATSEGDSNTHGPVYDLDSGVTTADGSAAHDGSLTTTHDSSVPNDAHSSGPDGAQTGQGDDAALDGNGVTESDASDGGSAYAPDCGAITAVLAGNASSLSGAIAVGDGTFAVASITGSATLAPALVATSSGFEGLVAMSGDAGGGYPLFGVGYANGSWSTPAALGGSASAIDAPAVALLGSNVEGAYLNPNHLYFHAEWAGASWNAGTDPVTPSGSTQSYGPVRASATATATELVIAYEGDDADLYAQSWTSGGGWQAAVQIGTTTLATNTPPAIVALTPGGTDDLLVVYDAPANPVSEPHIYYAVRTASTKAWSTPVEIDAAVYSPAAPSLAPMSGGRALLGWLGGNGQAYASEYDPTPTPTWTTAVGLGSSVVSAPPSLAAGTCDVDAVAALVSAGTVSVAKYASGAWQAPATISGISGASVAAIATSP